MATKDGARRPCRWDPIVAFALTLVVVGCGRREGAQLPAVTPAPSTTTASSPVEEEKVLNVYNWADYIDPAVIPAFEKEYRIKVNYDVFDSNDALETKLLTGKSGYDVVVPAATYLQRQIPAGVYQRLDKALLPNLKNIDETLSRTVEMNDAGNQYGVIYDWGTAGIAYNRKKIATAMPTAPLDSFAMVFNPAVIKNFNDCGVLILDAPEVVVESVLLYLGKDPNSESIKDLKAAESVLLSIRPYVRYISSTREIDALATGEICIAFVWSSDVGQVRSRAKEAGRVIEVEYILPKEGAMMYFDMLAIPADAPHPNNAHLFINFLLRPEIAARNSNLIKYANGDTPTPAINDAVRNDPGVYPPPDVQAKFHPEPVRTPEFTRLLTRTWTRFKTGK